MEILIISVLVVATVIAIFYVTKKTGTSISSKHGSGGDDGHFKGDNNDKTLN